MGELKTMAEARARCKELGITPARGITETRDRIARAERLLYDNGAVLLADEHTDTRSRTQRILCSGVSHLGLLLVDRQLDWQAFSLSPNQRSMIRVWGSGAVRNLPPNGSTLPGVATMQFRA